VDQYDVWNVYDIFNLGIFDIKLIMFNIPM